MKQLQSIALILPLFWACQNPSDNQLFKGKEFEGVITYRITYDNWPEDYSYGDTLKVWYSKGDLIKVYNGKAVKGFRKEIFLLNGNKYFFQVGNSDSLYSIDIGSDKYMKLVDSHHSFTDTRILGHTCEQIDQDLQYAGKNQAPFIFSLLYSKGVLPMDKDHFKDRKLSGFDRFIDESGAFYLRFRYTAQLANRSGLSTYTFTATNIREQPVDPAIFNTDTSKVKPFVF